MDLSGYLRQSREALEIAADAGLEGPMARAVDAVATALGRRLPMLVCGNGGSAADATHIAGELVGRFLKVRRAYNVMALTTDPAVLTALANDDGFDIVFSRQVEAYGQPGGVLMVISTSGASRNVLRAAEAARSQGMTVIGLTGRGGGDLAALCDIVLDVPLQSTPLIQQVHQCLYHYLCDAVETWLTNSGD